MDLEERIMELSRYGYACGQILAILLLDTVGEENPKLVQCMQGLNGGIGGSGDVCGCMAAGSCLIATLRVSLMKVALKAPIIRPLWENLPSGSPRKWNWNTWASTAEILWVPILRKKSSIVHPLSLPPTKNVWKYWKAGDCCKWKSEKP